MSGGDFCGEGGGFLSLEEPRDNHEKGFLKLAMVGRGDGLSAGTGGGDMVCEGETDRVVDDAREESSGGLSGSDVGVAVLE